MKRNKGNVYVLASRPYIKMSNYIIEQLDDKEIDAAYFYIAYDDRIANLTKNSYKCCETIDFKSCEELTFDMIKSAAQSGLYDLIIVDFIQAMCYTDKRKKRLKMTLTMYSLKKLSKQIGVDIIIMSSVRRRFDACKYKCPRAYDLLSFYSIVPFADVIVTMGQPYGDSFTYLEQIKGKKIADLPTRIFLSV